MFTLFQTENYLFELLSGGYDLRWWVSGCIFSGYSTNIFGFGVLEIVLISVGVAVGIGIIAFLIWICVYRHRKKKSETKYQPLANQT